MLTSRPCPIAGKLTPSCAPLVHVRLIIVPFRRHGLMRPSTWSSLHATGSTWERPHRKLARIPRTIASEQFRVCAPIHVYTEPCGNTFTRVSSSQTLAICPCQSPSFSQQPSLQLLCTAFSSAYMICIVSPTVSIYSIAHQLFLLAHFLYAIQLTQNYHMSTTCTVWSEIALPVLSGEYIYSFSL